MRKLKYIFIRLVFNALFALILLKCFIFGSQYGVELIGLNNWLIQLFCGISTALLFNAVLSLAQRTILLYLKHLQIASICVPDRNPNAVVFSRIGTVSVIVILNKILRGLAKEIIDAIKNGACSSIELFAEISHSTLAKGGKYVISKCFDYLDECVLAYCYTHPDDSLGSAAENAVVIFLENSATLLIKTTTVCLTSAFIKIVIAIVETLLLLKTMPYVTSNFPYIKKGETANNVTNRILSYDLESKDPTYVRVIPEFTNERKARTDEEMLNFNGRYVVYQIELESRNLPKYYTGEW